MAKQLLAASIAAPAFFGLNTQESGVTLQEGFALHADNCVIDKYGRLGARKGWVTRSASKDTVADANVGVDLKGIADFKDINGVNTRLSWNDTTFFKGTLDLTTITPTTSDTITTGNWQAATLNDHHFFYQRGYEPLIYTAESGSPAFESYSNHSHATAGMPSANTVLAAYGRLWAADTVTNKTTVWFTDVLDGAKYQTGTSGSIDISSVLTQGMDEIVALGAHNGYLIIFCKNNIIIYGDNDNFQLGMSTSSLTLVEVIEGVGCIARDSVQNTGEDILFLSNTGVRSLNRTVQEKSQPMRDISKNIRDDIIQAVTSEDLSLVKSVYSPVNAFYLLTFPSTTQTFCFDTRTPLQDGSFRVTIWPSLTPSAFLSSGSDLYFAQPDGIAEYFGYQDNGQKYEMAYYSNYFDLEMPNINKIVKKLAATTVGATGQTFTLKVGYEYSPIYYSYTFTLETGTVFEYSRPVDNLAEYGPSPLDAAGQPLPPVLISWDAGGVAPNTWAAGSAMSVASISEYSGSVLINDQKASTQGAGNIIQIGFTTEINGAPMSLQKLSIYAKQGKVL